MTQSQSSTTARRLGHVSILLWSESSILYDQCLPERTASTDTLQNASVSLDNHKEKAQNATYMVTPGESLPRDETVSSVTASSASSSQTIPATVTSTSNEAAALSDTPTASHHRLSNGAIAGIAIGSVVVLAAMGCLLFLLGRHRKEIEFLRRDVHVQRQSHRPDPPEVKHEYSSVGDHQQLPSYAYPYDGEDPKLRGHQRVDVPPFTGYAEPPQDTAAELSSSPVGTTMGRSGSPYSELDAPRNTVRVARRNILQTNRHAGGGRSESSDSS